MSRLVVSRKFTSYEVTLDLLKSIETYLLQKMPTILGLDPKTVDLEYSVSVTDDIGTERFVSVKDFGLTLFRDYTESVEMSVWCRRPKILILSINFNIEKDWSQISIQYEGENAREIVNSITEGITERLDSNKTSNYLYHHYLYSGVLYTLLIVGILSGFVSILDILSPSKTMTISRTTLYATSLLSLMILFSLYFGRRIHPYTMFDSRRIRAYKEWHKWFLFSIATFVVFDVIFYYVLKFFGL